MIERSVYVEADAPGTAVLMGGIGYTGAGLQREEILKNSSESDNYQNWRVRYSDDNGRTWNREAEIDEVNVQLDAGGIVSYPGRPEWDALGQRLYRVSMKRIWPGNPIYTFSWKDHKHPFHDHVLLSEDDGPLQCLRYEEGPDFDPEHPFDPAFGAANRAYRGQSICFDDEGGAFHPMVCYRRGDAYSFNEGGVVLMRRDESGAWHPSNMRYVSPDVSSRGLLEPDAVVLKSGRILIVCRGCDTPTTPGRKWMTYSDDGGRTLSPIEEFRYSDGTSFYSPSSIHRFIRSTRTGALYWIGNICDKPPVRNLPRYPLYIGLVDEDRMGLVRDSLMVIDDRGMDDPESINFSNFLLLEDRETWDIELYMTRGAAWDVPGWKSSVYRYVFSP